MSFGSSNPPWQRNTLGNAGQPNAIANLQTQMMNTNFVGFQGLTMSNSAPQNNLTLIPQLGANIANLNNTNAMFNQTLQYQNRPGLNPNAFGPVQTTPQILHHQSQGQTNQTPSQNNQNNGASQMCNNSAFKWNTNLVQQVAATNQGHGVSARAVVSQSQMSYSVQSSQQSQQQQQGPARNFAGYGANQSQNTHANNFERTSNSVRSSNHSSRQSPPARRSSTDRNRDRRDDEDRKRRKEREREREKEQDKRDDRSPVRRISPRRRARPIPRYMVQIPKVTLNATEADIMELRRRYNNLYIPSDFFFSRIRWSESFPCHAPFSIRKPSTFHIFHKSVENPNGSDNGAIFDPPDADDIYSAKVMLMSVPPMPDFYRKCFASPDEKDRDDLLHPSRLISFLVGVLGKNEPMVIGGAWSPSLDGPNPEKDPTVLIKTAIRTCKALTGIDLSPCTQWFRFCELYYRRKGRTQTVVIYLPDVRSCLPTRFEWDELSVKYKKHLELKKHIGDTDGMDVGDKKHTKLDDSLDDGSNADVEMADKSNKSSSNVSSDGDNHNQDKIVDSSEAKTVDGELNSTSSMAAISKDGNTDESKIEPTHFSDLEVKTMKIQELRDQLDARGLPSKGLKPQLAARLTKALKSEQNDSIIAENQNESNVDESEAKAGSNSSNEVLDCASNDSMDIDLADIVVIDEYDSTKADKSDSRSKRSSSKKTEEREHRYLEKRYRLPENPQILCHPVQNSSLDKFTCEVRSLSILLDYRPEDSKKHCFEVSLFAELFNEMLMRDFGFTIYKVLYSMPEMESSSEHESKEKRDKSTDDEPKEKRYRKDNETTNDSKSSKRDESSSSSNHEKSKSEIDKDKDSKSSKDSRSKDKEKEKDRDKEKDKEKSHRERRVSRRDEESDDERSIDGKKRETKKLVIVDPDLLLSFVYFDQTHCGYIFSSHLEELFYSLGLRLSRADAKKIINKVAPRSLFYRKLTDKPKDEATPAILSESIENVEELGFGNNSFLPFHENAASSQMNKIAVKSIIKEETTKSGSSIVEKIGDGSECTNENNMVMYKGALIDVEKLLQQLNRSEKAREETEIRLTELSKTHNELQSSNSKAKDKIKDLQSELKSCSRKATDSESSLNSANKKCNEYYSLLCGIHDKISPIFVKSERSASKKESSTRDKDRRDREKEKEKDKGASVKEKEAKEKVDVKLEMKQEKDKPEKEKSEKSEKQDEN